MQTLKELVEKVPPELEPEVKDLGQSYTSVELQHKILQWWDK